MRWREMDVRRENTDVWWIGFHPLEKKVSNALAYRPKRHFSQKNVSVSVPVSTSIQKCIHRGCSLKRSASRRIPSRTGSSGHPAGRSWRRRRKSTSAGSRRSTFSLKKLSIVWRPNGSPPQINKLNIIYIYIYIWKNIFFRAIGFLSE